MDSTEVLRQLTNRLSEFIEDKRVSGEIYGDLSDMFDECHWFVDTINTMAPESLSQEQVESFLIHVEIRMVRHLSIHIRSLRKRLPVILDAIATEDQDPSDEM